MNEVNELHSLLERRDRRERMARFMVDRRIEDVTSADFALTPRTRRLQCWHDGDKGRKLCPQVLIHAVPDNANGIAWSLSDDPLTLT